MTKPSKTPWISYYSNNGKYNKARNEKTGQLSKLDASIGTYVKEYPYKPVTMFNPTAREERAVLHIYAEPGADIRFFRGHGEKWGNLKI